MSSEIKTGNAATLLQAIKYTNYQFNININKMNNLAFTITNNEFQYKTTICKQYVNRFKWNNDKTRGSIFSGCLSSHYSYSVMDFQAIESLALNHHPKDAKGFLFVINRLAVSGYVQLMTDKTLMVDYSPRNLEVYIIPASQLFSFTFAPQTIGQSIQFFVSNESMKTILSPALAVMLERRPFLPLSELLNDCLYEELCRQSDIFFNHSADGMNTSVIISLLSILRNFNDFAERTFIVNPVYPYPNSIQSQRPYEKYKQIA